MDMTERAYWLAYQAGYPGGSYDVVRRVISYYGSLEAFWKARDTVPVPTLKEETRHKLLSVRLQADPGKIQEDCKRKGIGTVSRLDEDYPIELKDVEDCPAVLFYIGDLSLASDRPCAAIVGSRRSTAYGRAMSGVFARVFSDEGMCVVSGMAKGIDTAAQEAVLEASGATVAVLGCGVDVVYPYENKGLHKRICEKGLVLSEFPPGTRPSHWHFPLRNRIISGMSRFVLMVEGEARSGALITCEWASTQGRDVWALPGPVTNPYSIGPLQLIRDGAMVAISPQEVLRTYRGESGYEARKMKVRKEKTASATQLSLPVSINDALSSLSAGDRKLYNAISYYPVHIDRLIETVSKTADGNLYMCLTKLSSLRLIEKLPGDYYQRI